MWSPESCVAAAQCSWVPVSGALKSKSRQQLDRCLAATVWAARHPSNMHHSLSPLAAWKPHQCTSAWRHRLKSTRRKLEHVNQKPVRDVSELKHRLIETWSATSRASLIRRLISYVCQKLSKHNVVWQSYCKIKRVHFFAPQCILAEMYQRTRKKMSVFIAEPPPQSTWRMKIT